MEPETRSFAVAKVGELEPGHAKFIKIGRLEIALFNIDGTFYAIDDQCTHMRARLSDGYIEGHIVECPLHFGKFDIRTGKACSPPVTEDTRTYPVVVEDDVVSLKLTLKASA